MIVTDFVSPTVASSLVARATPKPEAVEVMSYTPTGRELKRNFPSGAVPVFRRKPVCVSSIDTSAAFMLWPDESRMRPSTDALPVSDYAQIGDEAQIKIAILSIVCTMNVSRISS